MVTFVYTPETPLGTDPNFPDGTTTQPDEQTFDFTAGWFYQPISSLPPGTDGGISVIDVNTMAELKTATLNQMYNGTLFGQPVGSPPSQVIYDVATGNGTDLYMLMDNGLGHGVAGEFCRFTRVDPTFLTVTGEFYLSAAFPPPIKCIVGNLGVVNQTTTNTVVAYLSNSALGEGPQIMDGTGMVPIDMGPNPNFGAIPNNLAVIPGKMRVDGSCDFLMLNAADDATGRIDIWTCNVKNTSAPAWQATHSYTTGTVVSPSLGATTTLFKANTPGGTSGSIEPTWNRTFGGTTSDGSVVWTTISALTVTSTLTGTANILGTFTPSPHLYIEQSNYDTTHDTIIMWLTNGAGGPEGAPIWLMSFNYDGSINWTTHLASQSGLLTSKGQSLLNGSTLMIGNSSNLTIINTATGAVEATGAVGVSAGSFYRVYNATTESYYTFALAGPGFSRVTFTTAAHRPFVMRPSR